MYQQKITEAHTILRSSENTPKNPGEKKILSSTIIPVEVFVIFVIYNQQSFTINDLIKLFDVNHKIKLPFLRMQQISEGLVNAGKVRVHKAKNKQNHLVKYYSFKTIL